MNATRLLKLLCVTAVAASPGWALTRPTTDVEVGRVTGMVYQGRTERIRGFDTVTSSDVPSARAIYKVYEGLYEYKYLARPYAVRPNLATGMPEISPDGLTYTFHLKKGVRFADDPC